MVWKMDELGEPYFDPLDHGRPGDVIPVSGGGQRLGFEWEGDGCHEYGGGWSVQDEILDDHIRRGGSLLSLPRPVVLKPRLTKQSNEEFEKRVREIMAEKAKARTLNPLFNEIRKIG